MRLHAVIEEMGMCVLYSNDGGREGEGYRTCVNEEEDVAELARVTPGTKMKRNHKLFCLQHFPTDLY